MVRELNRPQAPQDFPENAPTAYPVFYRTYSRRTPEGDRETWPQVCARSLAGLVKLGQLTDSEADLIRRMQDKLWALPSGRWLWVGGTPWLENPDNYSGAYNCTSTNVTDWRAFGLMMDLAMMGCGTGAVLEPKYLDHLPIIRNPLTVEARGVQGEVPAGERQEDTTVTVTGDRVEIIVGDSRQGWVRSYQTLLELSSDERFGGRPVHVIVDVRNIRPTGEPLKGFGGVANPVKVPEMYHKLTKVLNGAVGRKLTSVECCLLIDEAAVVVVAGNVRRSAGMRQGISEDLAFATAKENLWQQDDQGNWRIDPDRDSLRMANHTRVFHHKPTEEECVAAVRKQFYSGEGAIQWAGEAIARSNGDLVPPERRAEFIAAYGAGQGREWLKAADPSQGDRELDHRLGRYGLNPCVTADTWVHTEFGPRQVRDLIGRQHGTYVNGELFSTTEAGFFQTGVQPVLKVTTREGVSLRLTGNHRLLKVTSQTQKRQYTEWTATEALQPGDRLCLHNHRDITPWPGAGTFAEGWLLGSLLGDGSLAQTAWRDQGILRFWGDTQAEMAAHAIATLRETVEHGGNLAGHYHPQHDLHQVSSSGLGALAAQFGIHRGQKWVSPEVEQSSYDFHRGFLRGLFDADGSVQGHHGKGISVRLAQSSLATLEAVQRMLLRLGIAARIYKNRRPAEMRMLPNADRVLAPYFCQAQHELVIANDSLLVFRDRVGFQQPDKRDKLNGLLDGYRRNLNRDRFTVTVQAIEPDGIEPVYDCTVPGPSRFDANGLVAHNCGEILGEDFHCNLSEIHLNQIDPTDRTAQRDAFTAGGLAVASLLNHRFQEERYRYSREVDPIVGVSFTGLFDFFVKAFGVEWLKWWEAGRPETPAGLDFKRQERDYLTFWRETVHHAVWEYCDRHGLRRPNRCTTVQPSGTKSLLTGASPGWHPPKAARFIRRITFRKNDPVALACMDYGYSIVPSQSDKDEAGNLLTDPFDPRCTEWLVEIPVAVSWADLPGADTIAIEHFSALAQFDFYMQVQRHYTTHNTSATIELREDEIEALGQAIHGAIARDEGYISAALLARFDAPFPRLPFEKIDRETYDHLHRGVLERRKVADFDSALKRYDRGEMVEAGPAGCDSDKCLMPEVNPS